MVQKPVSSRPRGRPRAYDPDAALQAALETFWKRGLAGTSLDEIVAATGMNRPSLYAAFGDKRALYMKALARYQAASAEALRDALAADTSLADALTWIFERAIALYVSGEGPARGCFSVSTATTEAIEDPEIRQMVADGTLRLDQAFEARIGRAQAEGDLPASARPEALGALCSATIHTLAVRARAGTPAEALQELAAQAVEIICGSGSPKPR
ncbi:MAG TPA: TetR/AcrR family transcriptional regulator [Caulobacteraceae bacterium]|nr:TetR/AcrR family transcriptional regulator [Caulobacteraceae bacterium]